MKNLGIYIHIPFCQKKCNYCAFFTFAGKLHKSPSYFQAIEKEIRNYSTKAKDYKVNTIYFGGGTPSLVDSTFITNIVDLIKDNFNISKDIEITIEANPESINNQKLDDYLNSGINRISIGLQSWQDNILKFMDRLYTIEEFEEKFNMVRESGFENINLDVILGVPGQTFENWTETIAKLIEFNPNHVACYSLELDVDSKWGRMFKAGKFSPLAEEQDRKMYWHAVEELKKAGYLHYEISNFCKTFKESKHNLSFWKGEEYLGIGAAAHGYFDLERYNNVYSIEKYIANMLTNKEVREDIEKPKGKDAMFEFLLLRLRIIEGLSIAEFKNTFHKDVFEIYKKEFDQLINENLVIKTDQKIILTKKGVDLINHVMSVLV